MVIGIDPGKTGAIVALDEAGKILWKHVTPVIGKEINWVKFASYLQAEYLLDLEDRATVYLEHVHAIYGASANNTFSFGGSFEGVKAQCAAFQIPIILIAPKKWQAVMWQGVPEYRKPPKKLTKKELEKKAAGQTVRVPKSKGAVDTKLMSKIAASRLFPGADLTATDKCEVPHDGIVDALLIAEYGRRSHS